MTGPDQPAEPVFVVRGEASAEEVAALVAVLQSVAAAALESGRRVLPEWSAPRRAVRRPHPPGTGAWRSSALPR